MNSTYQRGSRDPPENVITLQSRLNHRQPSLSEVKDRTVGFGYDFSGIKSELKMIQSGMTRVCVQCYGYLGLTNQTHEFRISGTPIIHTNSTFRIYTQKGGDWYVVYERGTTKCYTQKHKCQFRHSIIESVSLSSLLR